MIKYLSPTLAATFDKVSRICMKLQHRAYALTFTNSHCTSEHALGFTYPPTLKEHVLSGGQRNHLSIAQEDIAY